MRFVVIVSALPLILTGCLQNTALRPTLTPSSYAATGSGATGTQDGLDIGISGGGLVGGPVGSGLSRSERRMALEAEYRALENTPAGRPVTWQDEGSGRRGTVRAAQPYRVGSQDCRQYTHELELDGTVEQARGTACRNEDGSWTLLG